MFIKMNRFWRRSEVAAEYHIPRGQEGVIDAVPTAHSDEATGEEYVLGDDVDRAIDYAGLSGQRWRLIRCLWGRGPVLIDAVIEEVWGSDFEDADKALDSLIKHTRRWLREAGCPLGIRTKAGYAQLLPGGGNNNEQVQP